MRVVKEPPLRNLVLRDLTSEGETTLRVVASNQGDPYRETLSLTLESNATGDFSRYEHHGSVELEPEEERQLREFLVARHERRGRGWST